MCLRSMFVCVLFLKSVPCLAVFDMFVSVPCLAVFDMSVTVPCLAVFHFVGCFLCRVQHQKCANKCCHVWLCFQAKHNVFDLIDVWNAKLFVTITRAHPCSELFNEI